MSSTRTGGLRMGAGRTPQVTTDPHSAAVLQDDATKVFSTSVLVSAVRCTLTYVVFPWLLPALGLAKGIGPGVGLTVGIVAIGFNLASIRRFHASDHTWKWPITAVNCLVISLLTVLAVQDLVDIL